MKKPIYVFELSEDDNNLIKSIDLTDIEGDIELDSLSIEKNNITIDKEQYSSLIAVLMLEEGVKGFNDDYEPNEYGRRIESVLDKLNEQQQEIDYGER